MCMGAKVIGCTDSSVLALLIGTRQNGYRMVLCKALQDTQTLSGFQILVAIYTIIKDTTKTVLSL